MIELFLQVIKGPLCFVSQQPLSNLELVGTFFLKSNDGLQMHGLLLVVILVAIKAGAVEDMQCSIVFVLS
jgi:hypothetical protein